MNINAFMSIPSGSLAKINDESKRNQYIKRIFELPKQVKNMANSAKTGAYIRGLTKTYTLPETAGSSIAFAILQTLIGERMLTQLPMQLSSDLGIANDKAQKMAQEIERDIFAPISLELNKYLSQKRQQQNPVTGNIAASNQPPTQKPTNRFPRTPASPSNVLNLKNSPKPPSPPPIPKKDDSTIF